MQDASQKSPAHTQKLTAELKKAFPKLADSDIALLSTSPDKFYEAIKTKQSIEKADAEKTVKKLDAECEAACAADKASTPASAAAPAAKASTPAPASASAPTPTAKAS